MSEKKETVEETVKNPRIVCIAFHVGTQDYKEPPTPDSEYVVDDSSFVPIAEAIKQLGNGSQAGTKADLMYDFPDGKDNGMEIPFSRSSQFKDIAELSTEINNQQDSINEKIETAKADKKMREEIQKDLAPTPSAE